MAVIISAFPGTGKTWLTHRSIAGIKLRIIDSDSSDWSWEHVNGEKVRSKEFPKNYIDHIKQISSNADIVFVSSHKVVRDALDKSHVPYLLFYPDKALKNEYIERYRARGSDDTFIKVIEDNWDAWIDEIESQRHMYCISRIGMAKGTYLSDYIGGRDDG